MAKMLEGDGLIEYLDEIEGAGMAVTKQWADLWRDATAYVWGEQLKGVRRNPDWDYIVVNMIYPLIMQSIAKQAKNHPKIICRAWDQSEAEWADQWQGLAQYIWQKVLDMRTDGIMAQLDSAIYGYGVGKSYWIPKFEWSDQAQGWQGEVGHRLIHPCGFWADPRADRIRDAECMGTVRKVSLEWAQAQWPKYAKQIEEKAAEPDDLAEYEYSDARPGPSGPVYKNQRAARRRRGFLNRFVSLILGQHAANEGNTVSAAGDEAAVRQRTVWVRETYFRDPSVEHIQLQDAAPAKRLVDEGVVYIDPQDPDALYRWMETKEPVGKDEWPQVLKSEYDKPHFPRGRMVIRVGGVVVNPEIEEQVYTRSRWPFNVLPYHILPHMWQGTNAVEMSRSSQDMLNVTMAYILQHVKMTSNPQKVIELGTIAKDKCGRARILHDKAGEMIVVNKGKLDKIKNLAGDQLDPNVWSLVQFLTRDVETQQFMHAVAQGKASSSGMSATEAARLDTNANDLVYLRSVFYERWVEGTARSQLEIAQEHYDEDRRIRIIGWNGDTEPGKMTQEMKRVEVDLEIESGTTLPFDEERVKNDYLAAYKLCADPNLNPMLEEVLRKLNIANRDRILARHEQLKLFKQFMALAQKAQQLAAQIQQAGHGAEGQPPNAEAIAAATAQAQQQISQEALALLAQVGQMGRQGAA